MLPPRKFVEFFIKNQSMIIYNKKIISLLSYMKFMDFLIDKYKYIRKPNDYLITNSYLLLRWTIHKNIRDHTKLIRLEFRMDAFLFHVHYFNSKKIITSKTYHISNPIIESELNHIFNELKHKCDLTKFFRKS